jgi:hypothetical protein
MLETEQLRSDERAPTLEPALESEDVVLPVAAVAAERANRHQAAARGEAAEASQGNTEGVSRLGGAKHTNVFHDNSF